MSEKMLVTQALDERDLLVKKNVDKIAKASFVDTILVLQISSSLTGMFLISRNSTFILYE